MSSYASSSSSTTLQDRHLANLIYILRGANQRYQQIASSVRESITPTQHARLRAKRLGLRLNIELALKLDQKFVSTVPLPVISTTPPPPVVTRHIHAPRPTHRSIPTIIIPAPVKAQVLRSKWSPSPVVGPAHGIIHGNQRAVDVPMDIEDAQEEEEQAMEGEDSDTSSLSSGSDSCGPVTPENTTLLVRIKRKSSEIGKSEKRTKRCTRA